MNQPSGQGAERRRQQRYEVQCRVVAISASRRGGLVQPIKIEALAVDLSFGGARLRTRVPFHARRLWLRLSRPAGKLGFIECRIVRAEALEVKTPRSTDGFYEYGLQFRTPLTHEQLAQVVQPDAIEDSA